MNNLTGRSERFSVQNESMLRRSDLTFSQQKEVLCALDAVDHFLHAEKSTSSNKGENVIEVIKGTPIRRRSNNGKWWCRLEDMSH
jgi:hypothetical protein